MLRRPSQLSSDAMPQALNWPQGQQSSMLYRTGRQSVLIADDDRDSRESLGQLLELSGHCVSYAGDGIEALSAASTSHPDVVFLDIQMPGMNGYQVCRELRRDTGFGCARIYALSGLHGSDHERRCHEAGFDALLSKPLDPDVLTRLL